MGAEVERVTRHVIRDVRKRPKLDVDATPGNPWGSMPSDHISSAAITAMALSEVSVLYGAMGWTYVALAGFSVVYLGEHYLVDVIVGLAVAEAVRRGEPLASPLVRRVALNLERLAA
jgi:membrane-associated phospholipid phosphatase